MNTPSNLEVAFAMQKYGDSFIKALSQLIVVASGEDTLKIRGTWPEHWFKYLNKAKAMHDDETGNRPAIAAGDKVLFAGAIYEVAEVRKFTFAWMIGIYDEPPSKHVDWLKPSSVELVPRGD